MSRNAEIARLYAECVLTLDEIGAPYGLNKQQVSLIARNLGASRPQWHSANGRAALVEARKRCVGIPRPRSSKQSSVAAVELVLKGLSYRQAAEQLGISRNAVAGAVYRAGVTKDECAK